VLTTQHPLPAKVGTNFADKQWLLSQYSSLVDYGHGVVAVYEAGFIQDSITSFFNTHVWVGVEGIG
jgi:hypothetical protein